MKSAEQLHLGYTFDGPRKIDLPESTLESLDIATFAVSPLIYHLHASSGSTFAGVREFSAPEGQVGLDSALAKQLGLDVGDTVAIERVALPKGTQVTLKAKTDAIDWKSLLEVWLPQNCTALCVGDVLSIQYAGEWHELQVVDLAPKSDVGHAVCVVDTDMDLFIEAEASLTTDISAAPPALNWDTKIDLGSELITLSASVPPEVRTLFVRSSQIAYIGPEFATSPASFLAVASAPFDGEATAVSTAFLGSSFSITGSGILEISSKASSSESVPVIAREGEKTCSNCGKAIPEQSFMLHSTFCARNSVRCPTCNKQFFGTRNVPSDHWHCELCGSSGEGNYEFHKIKHAICEESGEVCACKVFKAATKTELAFHHATTCPLRNKICQFCHLLLPQGETTPVDAAQGLTEHESQCGNRTTDCPRCSRPIRLRSLKMHLLEHEEQRKQRKPPQMCSNRNCPNVVHSENSPALGLCAPCFGPLSVPGSNGDLVRVNGRAERRYLLQMTRGCGKSWCQNHFCKTGSAITRSVSESMGEINRIKEEGFHYFCVDEASTRKAMFVQLDDGVYDRGWRGMAISSCGTEAEASQWLERNASRINEQL